jgi:hypothetical protein
MYLTSAEECVPAVTKFLEERGAPKGSTLTIYQGDEVSKELAFGLREGFAVYLDGVNLPDEVYRTSDINIVIEEINRLLSGHGEIDGHWQGPTETALYVYGDSNSAMQPMIKGFMDAYPLCRGARIVNLTP